MTEPVRFPAEVPYDKWPNLYAVFTAMEGGDFGEAEKRWKAHTQDCLDTAGAIQSWWAKYVPAQPVPTKPDNIGMDEILPWFETPVNQVNVTIARVGGGKISASAESGGVECWISLDPTFPNDESKTSYGAGSTGYLYPEAGAKFYFKFTKGATEQMMRASMESK